MTSTIPKLIFQTWKSKTDIPENFAHWSKSFKDLNPDYKFRLWDDKDNRAFIEKNFPWFLDTYDAYPQEIFRADAVRYFFLFLYGGIYADMDTQCLKPLDSMLDIGGVVLGRMGTNPHFEHSIPNAIMMSKPRQEFWLLVMSLLVDPVIQHNNRPEYTTGPVVLKIAHDLYMSEYMEDTVQNRLANIRSRLAENQDAERTKSEVGLLPGFVFYPIDWNDRIHDAFLRKPLNDEKKVLSAEDVEKLFPQSMMVTYWSHSWEEQAK